MKSYENNHLDPWTLFSNYIEEPKMIPSRKICYQLIKEMKMFDHIAAHSEQVCRVALCLVAHMNNRSDRLNRNLVQAAALLHDITKTRSFDTGEDHALTGEQFLAERGYPEVGHIVGQHVRLEAYFNGPVPDEAQIINYADKRVLHDEVVSLERRMAYIVERYGKGPGLEERIQWLWKQSRRLEERLFEHIEFAPDALEDHLLDVSPG